MDARKKLITLREAEMILLQMASDDMTGLEHALMVIVKDLQLRMQVLEQGDRVKGKWL